MIFCSMLLLLLSLLLSSTIDEHGALHGTKYRKGPNSEEFTIVKNESFQVAI